MTENSCGQTALTSEQALIDLRDRPSPDILRVIAIGSPQVVQFFVMRLFQWVMQDRMNGLDNYQPSILVR
jgi:hypothetical protein